MFYFLGGHDIFTCTSSVLDIFTIHPASHPTTSLRSNPWAWHLSSPERRLLCGSTWRFCTTGPDGLDDFYVEIIQSIGAGGAKPPGGQSWTCSAPAFLKQPWRQGKSKVSDIVVMI